MRKIRIFILKDKIKKVKNIVTQYNVIAHLLSIITLVVTIIIAISAQNISEESYELNKKQQPLVYSVKSGNQDTYYDVEGCKLPCMSPMLKVNQGTINMLKILKFNGLELEILAQSNYDFIELLNKKDYAVEIKVEQNLTDTTNPIIYDYFFLYIKSGDGLSHLDLIYTKIDIANKKVEEPYRVTKLDLLQNNGKTNGDLGYTEMIEVYRELHKKISELPQNEMEIY